MKNYLLGIDIGTSACKVALFDADGRVAGTASADYPVYYPQTGWAEQDPDEWWEGICKAVRALIGKTGIDPAAIAGIGLDGQSWSAIPVSRDGRVLYRTPIWMDTRAQAQCERAEKALGADRFFGTSGNPLKPAYTLPKILWYRDTLPEVYRQTDKVLQSNAYVAWKLTGVMSQDKSQGYGLSCYDMRHDVWDTDQLRDLGLRTDLLPDICDCDAVVGGVSSEAAAQTGLVQGTPVVAGGLDAACGTLGAGVYKEGQTQEQGGQAGGMSICIEKYAAHPALILSRHVVPGRWLLQGGSVGGGAALKWMSEQLCAAEGAKAASEGRGIFEAMSDAAASVPAGSEGVVFLPYMSGERSPIWDPDSKGVFYGLDYGKTRAHMIRACMEGVAFSLKHNLYYASLAGAEVREMNAMGGAANSAVWTQIKADVTGCTMRVPASDTATTLGAALLAGVGIGLYRDYEEAVGRTIHIRKTYTPNPDNKAIYEANYHTYRGLYEAIRGSRDQWEEVK